MIDSAMHTRIFTLPFDTDLELFPDEVVERFCFNKKVHRMEAHFFANEAQSYWTVSVQYEVISKERVPKIFEALSEEHQLLYTRLKEWRKELADKMGVPA